MSQHFQEGDNIRYAQSKDGRTKYIYCFNFPGQSLSLKQIPISKKAKLQMLGNGAKLKWKQTGDGVEIRVPEKLKSATDYVWVIKVSE